MNYASSRNSGFVGAGSGCRCPDACAFAGAAVRAPLEVFWSVKGEYLFVDLGTRTINTLDIDGVPFRASYAVRDHIVRVGINYTFDWGGAVVARY